MGSAPYGLALRFLRARPLRSFLAVLSVLLGVGLLAALLTLNASTQAAVDAYLAKQYGTFDLMAGYRVADRRLSETDLAAFREVPGVTDVAGILIPYMLESHPDLAPIRLNYYGVPDSPLGRQFMTVIEGAFPAPGEVAVSEVWAKRAGLQVGGLLELPFPPHGSREVRISGLLPTIGELSVGIGLFDRGWLEEATGRPGATFTLINTAKGTDFQWISSALRSTSPELEVDQRKFLDEARKNLNALRPVALGMGLAALMAAGFLLTGAFRLSLTERTQELAMLRAVGALPGQVRRLVLIEALLVGLVGSLLGAVSGAAGASVLSGVAARLMQIEPVAPVLPWSGLALVIVGGVLLALLSALGVARSAGATEPLRAMRPDLPAEEQGARRGGRFGLILIGLGLVGLLIRPSLPDSAELDFLRPLVGSSSGLAVAIGLLLGAQPLLPGMLWLIAYPFRHTVEGPLVIRSLLRHRRRSGNTISTVAFGLVLVVTLLTFTSSLLGSWYQQLRAEHPSDIRLEVPRLFRRGVSPTLAQEIASLPGVTAVASVGEEYSVLVTDWDWSRADPNWLAERAEWDGRYWKGYQTLGLQWADLPGLVEMGAYRIREGSLDQWGASAIAFTKLRAEQLGAKVGDQVGINVSQAITADRVAKPQVRSFTVVAILEDASYKLPRAVIAGPLPGGSESLMAIYANTDPALTAAAKAGVKELLQEMAYNLAEYSDYEGATAEFRAQVGQRLALLLAVAGVMAAVAVMSLANTMVTSIAERRQEFTLLRSVGATPAQVRRQILLEAALLGLVGGILGLAGGVTLGMGALTGLGLPLGEVRLPWAAMGSGLLLSLGLACLAALGPARLVSERVRL